MYRIDLIRPDLVYFGKNVPIDRSIHHATLFSQISILTFAAQSCFRLPPCSFAHLSFPSARGTGVGSCLTSPLNFAVELDRNVIMFTDGPRCLYKPRT